MNMDEIKIKIQKQDGNLSIKQFLKKNHVGRGKIEEIRVHKSSYINGTYHSIEDELSQDDILSFFIQEEPDFLPDELPLQVVYEDNYILVVNKPTGLIIYPDNKNKTGTLVNRVANYYLKHNIHRKIRYLHRIDKETTGLILFAKDFLSEAILLKDIETHAIQRTYLALIEGELFNKNGVIKKNIAEDRHVNGKMCVNEKGKEAITFYQVVETFSNYSLVEFQLLTGRTHQIRVHASFLHHPLLGDVLYHGNKQFISRTALHSYKMELLHPIRKEKLIIKVDLPEDMKKLLK